MSRRRWSATSRELLFLQPRGLSALLPASLFTSDAPLCYVRCLPTMSPFPCRGAKCFPTLPEGPGEVPGDGPGDDSAWGWQSCTENLHQVTRLVALAWCSARSPAVH